MLPQENGFNISNGRAMVSLGPIKNRRHCTYQCAHCYVHSDFASYPKLDIKEIVKYLEDRAASFDVVYVSGDTDSFAPPRTEKGLELLEELTSLNKDILFTTRAIFDESQINVVKSISDKLKSKEKLLIGCVSVSRLYEAPHIEPHPIPSPFERLNLLKKLKDTGVITVLAMRPFLPIIPEEEYIEIIELSEKHVDVILGETWYVDEGGKLEESVLGPGKKIMEDVIFAKMDFDENGKLWKVFQGTKIRKRVEECCKKYEIPFYMRSKPAITFLRNKYLASP